MNECLTWDMRNGLHTWIDWVFLPVVDVGTDDNSQHIHRIQAQVT